MCQGCVAVLIGVLLPPAEGAAASREIVQCRGRATGAPLAGPAVPRGLLLMLLLTSGPGTVFKMCGGVCSTNQNTT